MKLPTVGKKKLYLGFGNYGSYSVKRSGCILRGTANLIGHILSKNHLLHDAIGGNMIKLKGLVRGRTQFNDDFRYKKRYWKLKDEVED